MILHEIGHTKDCNQFDADKEEAEWIMIKRSLEFLPKSEIAADSYAASLIGIDNAIKSLVWLVRNTDLSTISKIEMLRRAKALKVKK